MSNQTTTSPFWGDHLPPQASYLLFLGLLPAGPTSVYPFSLARICCSAPAVSYRFNRFSRSPVQVNLLADMRGPPQINLCAPPLASCKSRNCVNNMIPQLPLTRVLLSHAHGNPVTFVGCTCTHFPDKEGEAWSSGGALAVLELPPQPCADFVQ